MRKHEPTEVLRTEEGAPPGWTRILRKRLSGKTIGRYDVYVQSPTGRVLRSRSQVCAYLKKGGYDGVSVDDFDFSRQNIIFPEAELDHSVGPSPDQDETIGLSDPEDSVFTEDGSEQILCEGEVSISVESVSACEDFQYSPYDFLLEHYSHDQWKVVLAGMFLEKHGKKEPPQLRDTLAAFFSRFKSAEELHLSGWVQVDALLRSKGYDVSFARFITNYTFDFVTARQANPKFPANEVDGLSEYVRGCFSAFFLKERADGQDDQCVMYLDWLSNCDENAHVARYFVNR